MALLASAGVESNGAFLEGSPPGRSTGRVWIRSAFNRRNHCTTGATNTSEIGLTVTDVTPTSGPALSPALLASLCVETKLNVGEDWFEKLHVYPGGTTDNPSYQQDFKVQFGDILGQVDREWEMFNAFRRNTATLITIDESAVDPGIELPGTATSDTIGPLTSLLGAASTFNFNLTTGLGTPALRTVRALEDGLTRFNAPITFGFDIATTAYEVSGARVAMIMFNYSLPFTEEIGFLTDIIPTSGGKEQRIALRKQGREAYNCRYELNGVERQRLSSILFEWHANTFGLPLFHLQVRTTATASLGANQFQITGGDDADFRVGGLALALTDQFTFDIVEVAAVTNTLVTIVGVTTNEYLAGTALIPVRTVRIRGQVRTRMAKFGGVETFTVRFESTDSDTGTPAGDTTLWNPNTYLGKPLLDDCNIQGLHMTTTLMNEIVVIDNQTGLTSGSSAWDHDKRLSSKGFFMSTRSAIAQVKAFVRGVRGKQISFWMPTFTDDLTVGDDLVSGSTELHIEFIDYTRFVQSREHKRTIRITFTDGSTLERVVQSSADHSSDATLETLTLDDTWPSNKTVAEVDNIMFYELVRFNTDNFRFRYDRDGKARLGTAIITVFD